MVFVVVTELTSLLHQLMNRSTQDLPASCLLGLAANHSRHTALPSAQACLCRLPRKCVRVGASSISIHLRYN